MSIYKTEPSQTDGVPSGIPYIVANEAAERFSFYGMKGILVVFMTKFLIDSSGQLDTMSSEDAMAWYHSFTSAVYFFPLLGALLSDWFFGKYRTILCLSVVYCLGHLSLACMDIHHPVIQNLMEPKQWLLVGLALIAIGSGGIKPCVSAHVGDQFGKQNSHLMEKIFGWFYFSINLGAFVSTLLTPVLLNHKDFGPAWAFGIPGVLMAIATIFFWMGRNRFIHIPPGGTAFIKEVFSSEGIFALLRLFVIYIFVAMFWALFDQTGSAWVLQAEQMDRYFLGVEWHSSQIQAINPIMIMVFIPIFNGIKLKTINIPGIYTLMGRVFKMTPLRKISLGFFLTVPAFLIPAWIQQEIDSGAIVNISWQLMAYVVMTAAEVFVSITCLEFSYTQAPKKMKSIVMAAYLLSVSLGNLFVSGVNIFIQTDPPAFKADLAGEYVLSLQGTDARTTVSDQIIIYVGDALPPEEVTIKDSELLLSVPLNKAGRPSEQINIFALGDSGKLDGEISYLWSADSPDVHFNIQGKRFTSLSVAQEGQYAISIEYKVGKKSIQKTLSLTISEQNLPPLVDAGPDQYLKTGSEVILDGSSSKDLLGEDILWKWQIVSKPTDSRAQLINEAELSSGSKLNPTQYYLFFAGLMFITALLFIPYAMVYKEKKYIQGDEENQESQPKK